METKLHWIEGPWRGRLAISPRPRGGDWLEDEIRAWSKSGISFVVSLLTPNEEVDLDLTRESELCSVYNISFISFPIPDLSVPSSQQDALNLIEDLEHRLIEGRNVVIHCRGGIGRSGLVAASLLVASGIEPDEAIRRVSIARGFTVPETPEQQKWVEDFEHVGAALSR